MENTYNGWSNRETWLTNMYFNEEFVEQLKFVTVSNDGPLDVSDTAVVIETYFNELIEDHMEGVSQFLKDFIDLGLINFYEIAEVMHEDLLEWTKQNV